jgi:hypothetical protein
MKAASRNWQVKIRDTGLHSFGFQLSGNRFVAMPAVGYCMKKRELGPLRLVQVTPLNDHALLLVLGRDESRLPLASTAKRRWSFDRSAAEYPRVAPFHANPILI